MAQILWWKMGQKDCKSQTKRMTVTKEVLPDVTGEGESVFFSATALGRLPMLQGMALWPYAHANTGSIKRIKFEKEYTKS